MHLNLISIFMSLKNHDRHTFALYSDRVTAFLDSIGKNIIIEDKILYHRIAHVLRLSYA